MVVRGPRDPLPPLFSDVASSLNFALSSYVEFFYGGRWNRVVYYCTVLEGVGPRSVATRQAMVGGLALLARRSRPLSLASAKKTSNEAKSLEDIVLDDQ